MGKGKRNIRDQLKPVLARGKFSHWTSKLDFSQSNLITDISANRRSHSRKLAISYFVKILQCVALEFSYLSQIKEASRHYSFSLV